MFTTVTTKTKKTTKVVVKTTILVGLSSLGLC